MHPFICISSRLRIKLRGDPTEPLFIILAGDAIRRYALLAVTLYLVPSL